MGDGAFKPNTTMLGSLPENTMDFGLIDELLIDGFWLETTDDSNFWQPGPSTYLDNSSSFYSQTSDINITHFNSNLNQASFSEEEKHSNLTDNRYPIHIQGDQVVAEQSPKKESILHSASTNHSKSFLVEGTEMNRRLWIGPNRNLTPNALVRSRLVQAIEYLKDSTRDKDVLIQLWVPVKRGGKKVLTTNNQPFSFNPNHKSLAEYRHVSKNYQFALEEDSKEFLGLPGRVFLKKLPEWTPDVRFFKREEYPRVNHAQQYNIGGSIALPVFERGSGACLGVVEIISTSQMLSHRPELESVCKALEAVDLKSSDISVPPEAKDCNESYRVALAEIKDVLQCVCDLHKLPLAQTWVPCNQQGKGGCRHSDETYADCVSTVDSACYVRDPQVWDFHVACSEHHLLKGEGVAGGAFTTNQPCFATDITAFSKTEYPLSHHAKLFHFCAAVAVRLRSIYTGSADFVLEFFLPLDCRDAESQKQMLNSLSLVIQQICRSLRVVTDQELKEEVAPPTVKRKFSSGNKFDKEESPASISPSKKSSQDASSWIAMATSMGDEGKGKGLAFSLDSHKKEPEGGEFKLTPYWDKNPPELHQMSSITDHTQIQQSSGLRENASGSCEYSLTREHHHYSGTRRASERRRTKTEKTISLQVLRQYFAGSLKDAAKSIGVCPTTLKRICRQHGITRWPSRKIKKVGHSLKKLQLVIDSVQGAEGSIQLSSFYNNFPQLSSTSLASPSQLPSNTSDDQQKLSPATTASKSPSSSASHSSSSSFCCSVGATQSNFPVNSSSVKDDSSAEQCIETLKRAHSDAELQNMVQGGTKLLVRSQSHKILPQDVSLEALPPLPTKASNQIVQDGSTLRVKAAFGDEKIRFSIQPNWGFETLLQEVRRRFNIDDANRIDLKYLDDDSEWVLLTCDADLEECIDIHKSSRSRTIKLSLNLPCHRNLPGSFGSRVLS